MADSFLFNLHQFVISFLCLFYVYYVWKDLASNNFNKLKHVSIQWIAPIFIGLFFGIYLYLLSQWGAISLFLSFSFAILIVLSLLDPKYAVGFFAFLLMARPWEYYKNELMGSMLRDVFILAVLSLIAHRIFRKKYYFQWNYTSAFMLAFLLWAFLSLFPSGASAVVVNDFTEVLLKDVIIYFLIVNAADRKDSIQPIKAALFLAITEKTIISFYKIYIIKELGTGDSINRMTGVGLIENANDIAAILILAIPFTISYFKEIKVKALKGFIAIVIFAFYFILIWEAKSRGATLGLGAFALAWYWLKIKNKKKGIVILISGLLLTFGALSQIERNSDDIEGSTKNRLIFWKAGLNMAIRNPLFGVGYGGYMEKLSEYANGNVGTEGAKKTIHSTWLLALAETGFVGFFFFMGTWIFTLKSAWKMRLENPEYFLAIVSYGTAVTFLSHTYMLYPYILIGLTVGHGQFYQSKAS
ncbi:MAG: O-antigen ligase family protein [Bacteriovorax sp.]|nr:O-antigen ligase family protein [Bacteriovorax sp.]